MLVLATYMYIAVCFAKTILVLIARLAYAALTLKAVLVFLSGVMIWATLKTCIVAWSTTRNSLI